jgi:hypothetical protein
MQKLNLNKAYLKPVETKAAEEPKPEAELEVYLFARHGNRPGAAIRAASLEEAERLYYETIKPIE